jgi:hypothetical protein
MARRGAGMPLKRGLGALKLVAQHHGHSLVKRRRLLRSSHFPSSSRVNTSSEKRTRRERKKKIKEHLHISFISFISFIKPANFLFSF